MTRCRNCGGNLSAHWLSTPEHPYWVHTDPYTGLLGSDECYPTPKADPIFA